MTTGQGASSAASSQPSFRSHLRLRTQLFFASALLSSAILLIAAWVINIQVVGQARQQVQTEVESLLPLYDAIWQEYGQSLATLGLTMSGSPIVKTIVGDPRASRDRATLREMVTDFAQGTTTAADLFIVTDGAGQVTFAEVGGAPFELASLPAASAVADSQQQHRGFISVGGRLFQLVLTPVLLHSGNVDYRNTLAVLGTGSELNRGKAEEVKRRIHSDVMFLSDARLYASSLPPSVEAQAVQTALSAGVGRASASAPVEVRLNGEPYLAFASDLPGADNERAGQVVILRSLAGAGRLFQAISNRLVLIWSLSIAAALILSYLTARRIIRPIDTLVAGVEELGRGNDDYVVPTDANGEIGALARSFDAMRGSLKRTQTALLRSERLATIGQMASSIVHDLRNPLATITTAAEVLNRDGLGRDRQQALLESQLRASQRMNVMLGELLEFSRGSYKLELATVSLAEVITRAVGEIAPQMARSGVILTLEVDDRFHIKADGERMRRVFENLLLNAVQSMPDGGEVIVRGAVEPGREGFVRVDVIDTGSGVPAEIRERVFEPFVSFGKSGGTGLGLAIAHRIVAGHGGELGFETNGQTSQTGSNFFVVLPLTTAGR